MLRLRSGAFTSKNGFSVVAPMSVSVPSSTAGSSASCWALENRWISSRNRIVPWPCSPRRWRARSITSRTSFTPAVTALSCSKARFVLPATARARVVLPVPGGPQKMALVSRSFSTSRRSGRPGLDQVLLADDVVEGARPQARRQRGLRLQALLRGGAEEVGHPADATRARRAGGVLLATLGRCPRRVPGGSAPSPAGARGSSGPRCCASGTWC